MEEKIEQVLNKLIVFIEQAGEFATEQAPLIVQEILLRAQILVCIAMIIPASMTLLLIWCAYLTIRYKKRIDFNGDILGWSIVGCLILLVVNSALFYSMSVKFITVWFAPRLYVLNYLREMF